MSFLDDEEKLRINVFDWNTEFKEIMDAGGFDVVIGNPPYVRQAFLNDFKKYFKINYSAYHGGADIYVYFIEKGINLINSKGIFSIIVANKWFITEYGKPLRNLLKKNNVDELVDFGDLKVFKNVTTYPCILSVSKVRNRQKFKVVNVQTLNFSDLDDYVRKNKYNIDLNRLSDDSWNLSSNDELELIDKIKADSIMLGYLVKGKIYRGIISGLDKVFVIDKSLKDKLVYDDKKNAEIIKPFLAGKDVQRYSSLRTEKYLIFTKRGINIDEYPSIKNYLMKYKNQLEPKPKNWKGKHWEGRKEGNYSWYEIQDSIDYYEELDKPKIVYLKFQVKPQFTLDTEGFFCNSAVWFMPEPNKELLGILNSKLGWFLISKYCTRIQNGYQLIFKYLQKIPIAKALVDGKNKTLQNISSKVDEIIVLKIKLEKSKIPQEKTAIQRQIEIADNQIDKLVYKLYGLTEEEIKIVEGNNNNW